MRFIRGFNKVLGAILLAFFFLFMVAFYLGGIALSIWITLMPWVAMPLVTDADMLVLDVETKVFVSFCGGIMFLVMLVLIYFTIDTWIDPPKSSFSVMPPSLKPKPPKPKNKTKPILG